ncbi:MAG: hypothetical protein EOO01_02230 [Chitinophagaceae bacterium]|nr:MAG: hypothetical protein EOO01_02230 [Chitinophagaceae bacterium]
MNLKNLSTLFLSASLFVFSSCKKDIVADESLTGEVVSSDATAANDVLETAAPVHTPRQIAINSNVSGYYETLPARYSLTTKKYPLIVFIHGIGELGTGLSRLNCCGLPYHINKKTFPAKFLVGGKYYSYIVVTPQFRVRPSAAQIQSVVDYAKGKYRVDAARVYVGGLSMGGGSTWDWSVVYGQNAAAIVPVCAGTKPTTTLAAGVAGKNLPIWSLNSSSDAAVPIQWGKDWISWIDARNTNYASKTKLTIWSGLSHNATWGKAWNPTTKVDGYNTYEWMLLYTRGTSTSGTTGSAAPAPAPLPNPTSPTSGNVAPVANAGSDVSVPKSWNYNPYVYATTSKDSDGWLTTFKWTKVSGPSTGTIVSPNASKTQLTGLSVGTYIFRVTVTDNNGGTDTDDVTVKITS